MSNNIGSPKGPRPHVWRTGPSETRHAMFKFWIQQKNQAQWRGEQFDLMFVEFEELWRDKWKNKGRGKTQYRSGRIDQSIPWSKDNYIIGTPLQLAVYTNTRGRPKGTDYWRVAGPAGVQYSSLKAASLVTGMSMSKINYRIHSKTALHAEWHWIKDEN